MFQNETFAPIRDALASAMTNAICQAGHSEDGQNCERRLQRRRRVLKSGRIVYHNGLGVMDAVVRDVTDLGARIKLAETLRLPRVCEFQFKDDKYRKVVRVIWKSATEAGIAFA